MKYTFILIDLNNLFWRTIISSLEKNVSIENHVIYNESIIIFLKKVKELINKFGYHESIIYFLCDNPESHINIRKILTNGQYKHTRESKDLPKNLYKTLNILIELLKNYSNNFRIVHSDYLEADDLTLPIKNSLEITDQKKCLFISADLDWARNLNKNCDWFNYHTLYTSFLFKEKYGFSPEGKSIQLWKALKGDNSDCISNAVPYLPKEILVDIINRFVDINELFKGLWDQNYPQQWKIKLKEAEASIRMNYQIVDFIEITEPLDNYIFICKENLKKLEFWFTTLCIPFESRMILNKKDETLFFERKKYKRI